LYNTHKGIFEDGGMLYIWSLEKKTNKHETVHLPLIAYIHSCGSVAPTHRTSERTPLIVQPCDITSKCCEYSRVASQKNPAVSKTLSEEFMSNRAGNS